MIRITVQIIFLIALISASIVEIRKPTGIKNRANTCYMNALLAAIHDVTPFRKAVYDNYQRTILTRAIAGVFARKQLNMLPVIDLERDMMATINYVMPDWEFGKFQDIDEFFKTIFMYLPQSVTDTVGFLQKEEIVVQGNGFVINEGRIEREQMITIKLPASKSKSKNLNLQELINCNLSQAESRSYTIHRQEHPIYFLQANIGSSIYEHNVQVIAQPKVLEYSDVVPVFIARRTRMTGSNSKDFRNDHIEIPELVTFPLHNGSSAEFTLVSFAVYHTGHYLAYGKSFPSRDWFVYNDHVVESPSYKKILEELENNAVMLFYVRKGSSINTPIPEPIEKWSLTSMIIQHMRSKLLPRIKKILKKT